MEKEECSLQFINYSVDKIIFKKNNAYDKDELELKAKFEHNINIDSQNKIYYVSLTANLFNSEEFNFKDCPFQLEISITGIFKLQNCEYIDDKIKDK